MIDVIYLNNGGIVRGIIIEQIPNVSLKIQTRDKSVFVYRYEEIEKITKEVGKGRGGEESKKPVLAWLFSFLWTGVGQIYNGQVVKGVIMFISGLVCHIVAVFYSNMYDEKMMGLHGGISSETLQFLMYVPLGISFVIWLWGQADAPIVAKKLNEKD